MDAYSITIFFSNNRTFINVADSRVPKGIFRTSKSYSPQVLVHYEKGLLACMDQKGDLQDFLASPEYAGFVYIDNVISHFLDNYTSSSTPTNTIYFNVFARYLQVLLLSFVDFYDDLPCFKMDTSTFVFVTPRVWGYRVTDADVCRIMADSGLCYDPARVTVYNDLNLRIEEIQEHLEVPKLKNCLYCTFYLQPHGLISTVDAFFSGTFHQRERVDLKDHIRPVRTRSLPSLPSSQADTIASVYAAWKEFLIRRFQWESNTEEENTTLFHDALNCMIVILKTESHKRIKDDQYVIDLENIELVPPTAEYPCGNDSDSSDDSETDDSSGTEEEEDDSEDEDNDDSSEDESSEEGTEDDDGWFSEDSDFIHPSLKNKHSTKSDDELFSEIMKHNVLYDLYVLSKPYFKELTSALHSAVTECSTRQVFIDLFKQQRNVGMDYLYLTWIFIYFIQYELGIISPGYVRVHFINAITGYGENANDYAFQRNNEWDARYTNTLGTLQQVNISLAMLNPKSVVVKKSSTLPDITKDRKEIDTIVHLNVSLEKSKVFVSDVYSNSVRDINTCDIEPFAVLKDMFLNQRLKTVADTIAATTSFHSFTKEDYESFDINDVQNEFFHTTCDVTTLDTILDAMQEIKDGLQTHKARVMFNHHAIKILFTLYIMHICKTLDSTISVNKQQVGYVVVVDPFLDAALGKKQSVIRYFAQAFGLISKNEDPRLRMVVFKKRRAYVLKLQEDPVFSNTPMLSNFLQIQITDTYCQATFNKMCTDNKKMPSTENDTFLFPCDFYKNITHVFWKYVQDTAKEVTCGDFEAYNVYMIDYLQKLKAVQVGDNLDTPFVMKLTDNTMSPFEFSHRNVIEAAVIPIIEKMVTFISFCLQHYGRISAPWHTFLMLEGITGDDARYETSILQQLLAYEINKQVKVFYQSDIRFHRDDVTLHKAKGVDLCTVNGEPLGLYSLTTGITHLHRTFNTTYALKFYLEDELEEGLSVYKVRSAIKHYGRSNKSLDISKMFVFAQEGSKMDSGRRGFRIENKTDKMLCIDYFRVSDAINSETIDSSSLANMTYKLMGSASFSDEFLLGKKYSAFPALLTQVWFRNDISVVDFDIDIPLDFTIAKGTHSTEPFTLCYSS